MGMHVHTADVRMEKPCANVCLMMIARTQRTCAHAQVPCMYVFVDIGVDVAHLVASVRANFRPGAALALAGTIQFALLHSGEFSPVFMPHLDVSAEVFVSVHSGEAQFVHRGM